MSESAVVAKVKEAVLPGRETFGKYAAAGVSVFSGFALSAYLTQKAAPSITNMLGDKVPLVSGGTVAAAASALVASIVHVFTRDNIGSWGKGGVHIRDITFYATAGAMAQLLGRVLLDIADRFGGGSAPMTRAKTFLGTITGN